MRAIFILACAAGVVVQPKAPGTKPPAKAVTTPPSMTEVLYDAPKDQAGDADQDGKRNATGDEFVEVCNTTGGAIELKGYALIDSDAWWFRTEEGKRTLDLTRYKHDGKDFVFVFPACSLAPGQCAVVFNGYSRAGGKSSGLGTHEKAGGKNDRFGGALVFDAEMKTLKASFGNDGDWVALV
ncbi:MAG: hypothetical protein AABZ53_14250, partial [Planctomycetota bacterium]